MILILTASVMYWSLVNKPGELIPTQVADAALPMASVDGEKETTPVGEPSDLSIDHTARSANDGIEDVGIEVKKDYPPDEE